MDIKDIKAIYKFIRNTDIFELEVEDTRGKLRIKRGVETSLLAPQALKYREEPGKAEVAEAKEAKSAPKDNVKVITSPMVGTFYRASGPDAAPFVENGTVIKSGQIVCIIEAMKLMNEIESDFGGKIVSILVENGQPVEYGEPLFHVEG